MKIANIKFREQQTKGSRVVACGQPARQTDIDTAMQIVACGCGLAKEPKNNPAICSYYDYAATEVMERCKNVTHYYNCHNKVHTAYARTKT
jgi:hypothetical protein